MNDPGDGWHKRNKIFVPDWTQSEGGVFVPFDLAVETWPPAPQEPFWYCFELPGCYIDCQTGEERSVTEFEVE